MNNSAASVLNIAIGMFLVLLNLSAYFLFSNLKDRTQKLYTKILDIHVSPKDKDRVLSLTYFQTKFKFYNQIIDLVSSVYGIGGILAGVSLIVNGFLLRSNHGFSNELSYVLPLIAEVLVIFVYPYFHFIKIKPCTVCLTNLNRRLVP